MYFGYGGYDPLYIWVMIGFVVAMAAQARVQSVYRKYAKVPSARGMTAAEVAGEMLARNGITDVTVERIGGSLTDNYNPKTSALSLSETVHDSNSLAALGVAAHEVGHVMQHYDEYIPLKIRSMLVPVAQLGSLAAVPLFLLGLFMSFEPLVTIGIGVFLAVVLFYLVTLPIEFNASSRAIAALEEGGYVTREESVPARKVLNAAGLTYVVAALNALLQLFRLIGLAGNGRRRS